MRVRSLQGNCGRVRVGGAFASEPVRTHSGTAIDDTPTATPTTARPATIAENVDPSAPSDPAPSTNSDAVQ
jgi:hypothetical protein